MRVWLDDLRPMPSDFTHWARTADEAIALLKTGLVEEISLDHDLGHSRSDGYEVELTGYTVAKFIEQSAAEGVMPEIRVHVHTQNTVGRENIRAAIRNAYRYWRRNG